jgi:hypothetical protein
MVRLSTLLLFCLDCPIAFVGNAHDALDLMVPMKEVIVSVSLLLLSSVHRLCFSLPFLILVTTALAILTTSPLFSLIL